MNIASEYVYLIKMTETAPKILSQLSVVCEYRWSGKDISKRFTIQNPAAGQPITTVQTGNASTVDAAVPASQKAFETWRWKARQERSVYLLKASDELQKHSHELAVLLCLGNGKPVKDASFDVGSLVQGFRYFGSIVDKLPSEFLDLAANIPTRCHPSGSGSWSGHARSFDPSPAGEDGVTGKLYQIRF
jgi:delta 1-pyrroline-5-carboxylate dehydrogenase